MLNKLGQLFIIGLKGTKLLPEESDFIVNNNIGGVILFDRNIESPEQLHKLTSDVFHLKDKMKNNYPPFISIDMEGGRVARLKPPFTQWPPMKTLSDMDSSTLCFKLALSMGAELNAMGINLNFSPCVDILTNPKNDLIGDRSFGSDPETVSKMSSAMIRGLVKSQIIPCAKHFPGHGNTILDSHEELPIEEVELDRLREVELVPFKKAFRARLDLVMTAHIKFTKVDADNPVTLSSLFLKDILREEYKYKGVVISDDLDMKALTNHYSRKEIPLQALNAGCDILLYCNDPTSPVIALEALKEAHKSGQLSSDTITTAFDRVMSLKKKALSGLQIKSFDEAKNLVGHPDHMKLAKAISNGDVPEELKKS